MASGRNYTLTLRAGEDGTQYLLIRGAPLAASRPARQRMPALAGSLKTLRTGFQKALRFASRRAYNGRRA